MLTDNLYQTRNNSRSGQRCCLKTKSLLCSACIGVLRLSGVLFRISKSLQFLDRIAVKVRLNAYQRILVILS